MMRAGYLPEEPMTLIPPVLLIDPANMARLMHHATTCVPNECCGLLIGRSIEEGVWIDRVVEASNIAESDRRRHFQVDWSTLLQTSKELRGTPQKLVGMYHSHPTGSFHPSSRDLSGAWPGYSCVILLPTSDGSWDVTCWFLPEQHRFFIPQPIQVSGASDEDSYDP